MNRKRLTSLILLTLLLKGAAWGSTISLTREELRTAGERIYMNETGGRKDLLVHWNVGEEFASLGIGHFIWYPVGYDGPFDESFPSLIAFYREKGVELPRLFEENSYCPWDSREEFYSMKDSSQVEEAIEFLDSTKDIQTAFIYKRLEGALDTMLQSTEEKLHVKKQFYRMVQTPGGLYPLIDYINFKGEGVKSTERYNSMGWGLLQILEGMQGENPGAEALSEFALQAKYVLKRRVDNSPPERGEERWLPGWYKRIDTYLN